VEEDRSQTRRLTVAEAAEILGITVEAIRGRIKRGTLTHEKVEDGTVYVFLSPDQMRPVVDQSNDQTADRTGLLIAEMQDRIRSLEEANRENRRIIAALTQRIPELEAPSEPRESPQTATEDVDKGGGAKEQSFTDEEAARGQSSDPTPRSNEARPWWRRLLGG
jgi:hypothetical protein